MHTRRLVAGVAAILMLSWPMVARGQCQGNRQSGGNGSSGPRSNGQSGMRTAQGGQPTSGGNTSNPSASSSSNQQQLQMQMAAMAQQQQQVQQQLAQAKQMQQQLTALRQQQRWENTQMRMASQSDNELQQALTNYDAYVREAARQELDRRSIVLSGRR